MEQTEQLPITSEPLDLRRILIFCLLAFVISGTAALYIALNGGPSAVPSVLILALWYMPGPAFAHLLTRLITKEGWSNLWLAPRFRQNWRTWLVAWFAPAILVVVGAALYFLIFPQHFDATLGAFRSTIDAALAQSGEELPLDLQTLILVQTVAAVLISPLLNALPTFGEEFGWRAYLQPKLMVLGWRRAMLWMGLIWGVWHWPLIAMGHNYGLDYVGAPWLGMLAFLLLTTAFGTLLGWLTIRGGSVWPAVIGHGALNGIGALPLLFAQEPANPLLGPGIFGLLAGVPLFIVALMIWRNVPSRR
jgi:membrane protease YdiL (CAAX protease family)